MGDAQSIEPSVHRRVQALDLLAELRGDEGAPVTVDQWRAAVVRTLFGRHANARQMFRRLHADMLRRGEIVETGDHVEIGDIPIVIQPARPVRTKVRAKLTSGRAWSAPGPEEEA
jgi:hypothetical protein